MLVVLQLHHVAIYAVHPHGSAAVPLPIDCLFVRPLLEGTSGQKGTRHPLTQAMERRHGLWLWMAGGTGSGRPLAVSAKQKVVRSRE